MGLQLFGENTFNQIKDNNKIDLTLLQSAFKQKFGEDIFERNYIFKKIENRQTTGKKIRTKAIDTDFFLTPDGKRFEYMQNRTPTPSPPDPSLPKANSKSK